MSKTPKIRASILFGMCLLVLLIYTEKTGPHWKEQPIEGGHITFTPIKINNETPQKNTPALKEVTVYLHGQWVNRINQRRNNALLPSLPRLFGPKSPFKPLFHAVITGPCTLFIESQNSNPITNNMTIPVPPGEWGIEVYPDYHLPKLFEGHSGEKENLKLAITSPQQRKTTVHTLELAWSGPQDIFLSTQSLIDLASITTPSQQETSPAKPPKEWIQSLKTHLETTPIRYQYDMPEKEGPGAGWQTVRTKKEMMQEEKATCLDISAWIAKNATESGLKPYLIANTGHILCSVSSIHGNLESSIPIEGTNLLKPPLKPTPTPRAPTEPPPEKAEEFLPHEPLPKIERKIPPQEPPANELFQIDLLHWAQYYRKKPPSQNLNPE